ncbi:hypothetical protein CEXT_380301 [Caerostris extrusa]|uniref:Uncharacterized protein n=1 Tax=Caerostris extrusa TaxID=172846 RepID=A0AAV4P5B3_CAEEX|nr:hypothetical protein CEXT_380301 [Caerostris extrusa]
MEIMKTLQALLNCIPAWSFAHANQATRTSEVCLWMYLFRRKTRFKQEKNRKSTGRKVQSDDDNNSTTTDVEDSPTSSVSLPCSVRAVVAPNSDASHKGGLNFQKQSYKKRFRSDDNQREQNSALFPQPKCYF